MKTPRSWYAAARPHGDYTNVTRNGGGKLLYPRVKGAKPGDETGDGCNNVGPGAKS